MKNLTLILLLLILPLSASAQETVVLSKVQGSAFQDMCSDIIKEAYKKIGINVTFIDFPGARALVMSTQGETDGEIGRMNGLDKKYPTLIKVPVIYAYMESAVFTKKLQFEVTG